MAGLWNHPPLLISLKKSVDHRILWAVVRMLCRTPPDLGPSDHSALSGHFKKCRRRHPLLRLRHVRVPPPRASEASHRTRARSIIIGRETRDRSLGQAGMKRKLMRPPRIEHRVGGRFLVSPPFFSSFMCIRTLSEERLRCAFITRPVITSSKRMDTTSHNHGSNVMRYTECRICISLSPRKANGPIPLTHRTAPYI